MIHKLHDNGMCTKLGVPTSITRLLSKSTEDIITYGNQVLRGLVNNNQGCVNYHKLYRIQYIIQYSIAFTLARKHDISIRKVFARYHNSLEYEYINNKGLRKTIKLALYTSLRRDKTFFPTWNLKIKDQVNYKYNDSNPLSRKCYICGNPHHHRMFHRKKISLLSMPYSIIEIEMIRINRRQLCLCNDCFTKVTDNTLKYNQITKRKLI